MRQFALRLLAALFTLPLLALAACTPETTATARPAVQTTPSFQRVAAVQGMTGRVVGIFCGDQQVTVASSSRVLEVLTGQWHNLGRSAGGLCTAAVFYRTALGEDRMVYVWGRSSSGGSGQRDTLVETNSSGTRTITMGMTLMVRFHPTDNGTARAEYFRTNDLVSVAALVAESINTN